MASYLITFVGADKRFVPNVLLYGALFGAVAAYVMGLLSDRFGRRRMFPLPARCPRPSTATCRSSPTPSPAKHAPA